MATLNHTPEFKNKDIADFIFANYGLPGILSSLPGDRDQNFKLSTDEGEKYIIKVANALEEPDFLVAQHKAWDHLTKHQITCPRVIKSRNGDSISQITSSNGRNHFVRLSTYINGIPYGEINFPSTTFLSNLGSYIGRMTEALSTFDHPAAHRKLIWDIKNCLNIINTHSVLISDREFRDLVDNLAVVYEENTVPNLLGLRESVIHNDANDYNILAIPDEGSENDNLIINGIIDFGDMVFSYTVADLAITIAYAILGKEDPLKAALVMTKNYHMEFPLKPIEISCLFGMIYMRLCMSACMAAYQTQFRPWDDYLEISQAPIRNTLPKLALINPKHAESAFMQACGIN